MSVGPTRGPVQRAGDGRDFTELFQRLDDLERQPPGRWVWAGDYPGDADTTPDSSPFLNGWANAGGGKRRLRYRRLNEWSVQIEGVVQGGTDGTAVINLPAFYRPDEDTQAPGVGGTWELRADGDLVFTAT